MTEISKNTHGEEIVYTIDVTSLKNEIVSLSKKVSELENIGKEQNQALQKEFAVLDAKVESWSGLTEPLLTYHESRVDDAKSDIQTVITYDAFILAIIAIVIGIVTFIFQKHMARSQEEAVSDAIKAIDGTIANGILPSNSNIREKLLNEIFGSQEFIKAFRGLMDFEGNSDDAEEKQMTGLVKNTTLDKETLTAVQRQIEVEKQGQKDDNKDKVKKGGL